MEPDQKQTILYIITQGHWGGAQTYIYELSTRLSRLYNVHIAVGEFPNNPDLQQKIQEYNRQESSQDQISILNLKHLLRHISPVHDILAILEIAKLIRTCRPDIIHLNSSKAGIIGPLSALFYRNPAKRVIYTVHGWVFDEALGKARVFIYKILERLSARLKTDIILLSKKDFSVASDKLKIPKSKLHLIPLGISAPQLILSREEAKAQIQSYLQNTKISSKAFIIGIIANLYHTKGIDIHLQALSRLPRAALEKTQTLIIGDGPEREKLLRLLETLDLKDHAHFLGFIDNATHLLSAFDLSAIPSRKEGSPYILKEAISRHVPVLISKVGDAEEYIVHKKTGLLAKPCNADDWTANILWSIENRQQLTSFSVLNQNKFHSVDEMTRETLKVYENRLKTES